MPNESVARPTDARDWIAEVRARGPAEVGRALGLEYDERRHALAPCPACGNERRHPKRQDKRGALGLTRDGQGFRCFECDASGDAVALAALVAVGRVPGKGDAAWRDVRAALANAGLCAPPPGVAAPTVRRLPPPAPPAPPPPPARPQLEEVTRAWAACSPATDDPEVAAWIRGRGLSPADVSDRDLARALPVSGPLPPWMRFEGESWRARTFRVVVPLYGPRGELESLHARALSPREANGRDKAASPSGAEVRGLVLADAVALAMLRGSAWPSRVVIAEGVPDFLTWATHYGDAAEDVAAILGVISGSWTEEVAARVPDRADVYVRTHGDEAGHKYASRITDTLAGRCSIYRRRKDG